MNVGIKFFSIIGLFFMLCICCFGEVKANTNDYKDSDRLAWFREAKFGLFIHWGVYSAMEGEYIGESIDGTVYTEENPFKCVWGGEWILWRAGIRREKYRSYAPLFTAKNFDPDSWVDLAKKAGARYIILTAKHHEGFLLYPSRYSDWCTTNSGAQGRDLIRELIDAAKRGGIKIGIYFSQNWDWMADGGFGEVPELNHGKYDEEQNRLYTINTCNIIGEMMERYGADLDIMYWDIPHINKNRTFSDMMKKAFMESPYYRPEILQNNRLSLFEPGDFDTPEENIDTISHVRESEMCVNICSSWGYSKYASANKPKNEILDRLLSIVSKGGNLLFGIPPKEDGTFSPEVKTSLEEIGDYVKFNGESIYGAEYNGFIAGQDFGRITRKENVLYLHYYTGDKVELIGVEGQIIRATTISGSPIEYVPILDGYSFKDVEKGSVIRVEFASLKINEGRIVNFVQPEVVLTPMAAVCQKGVLYLGGWDQPNLYYGGWTTFEPRLRWPLKIEYDDEYEVYITLSNGGKGTLKVQGQNETLTFEYPGVWDYDNYKEYKIGNIFLEAGKVNLDIYRTQGEPMNIQQVRIVKTNRTSFAWEGRGAGINLIFHKRSFDVFVRVKGIYHIKVYNISGIKIFDDIQTIEDMGVYQFKPAISPGIYVVEVSQGNTVLKMEKFISY